MKKLFEILQTLWGCDHQPGYWKAQKDNTVVYECCKCRQLVTSATILDLPAPHRTQEAKAPTEAMPTGIDRQWLDEMKVKF